MTKIQIRRGTTAQWATAATVLDVGEPGQDTTTGVIKVGDGSTAWASLLPTGGPTQAIRVTDATSSTLSGTLVAGHLTPVDATAGAAVRTLPAASSVAAGGVTAVKKADTSTNAVTVNRAGSDVIFGTGSGGTSRSISLPSEAVTFTSNGVNAWTVLASDTPVSQLDLRYPPIAATPVASSATSGTLTAGAEHNLSPASAATWTLPTGVAATKLPTTVKNNGSATVTVARGGSDTINGATTSVSIAPTEWARFTSDGSGAWTQSGTAGQSGTYAAIGRGLAGGATFVATGDSITASNSDNTNNSHADSWATHCTLASGGSLRLLANAGHGGYTSTQLLAVLQSEVIALSPTVVGIMWGTNDTLDGANRPTTTAANIRAAVAALRAAGIFVFLNTIPPQGNAALAAPAAPTVTAATTGGTMAANTYYYKCTYTNGTGETTASAATSVTTSGSTSSVAVDVPWLEGSSGAKIYVSTDNSTWHLLGSLTSSAQSKYGQRYTDTTGSVAGAAPPGSNTTASAWDSTAQRKFNTINAWIREYGRSSGVPVADQHAILVDATTGTYGVGYTLDGTHPTNTRQKRMGDVAWAAISPYIPKGAGQVTQDNLDPLNLYTNGCLINGSGSLPSSYASYGGSASGFTDTLGAKTGFLGKALQSARTVPDVRFHDSPTVSTGFSVGDVLRIGWVFQIEGSEAGGGQASFEVRCNGANASPAKLILNATDCGPAVWMTKFTVPAATTSVYFKAPYLACGPCTASLGQITVYNETTGGLLL